MPYSRFFNVANVSFNAIRENKSPADISELTVDLYNVRKFPTLLKVALHDYFVYIKSDKTEEALEPNTNVLRQKSKS